MEKLKEYWNDIVKYLKEVWIEIRPNKGRVIWPTYDNVKLATKVVIISSLGLGMFIGFFDVILSEIFKWLIGKGGL